MIQFKNYQVPCAFNLTMNFKGTQNMNINYINDLFKSRTHEQDSEYVLAYVSYKGEEKLESNYGM